MEFVQRIWAIVPVPVWLTLSATTVIIGDYLAKRWSIDRGATLFISAMAAYALSGPFYLPTLLKEGLVVTSLIWTIITTLGLLVVGMLIYHEHLTTSQSIGVILGIISMILLV